MTLNRDKETVLWSWLKKGLTHVKVPKHLQRIEDTTKSGTPDVEGCIAGQSFWIELKIAYELEKSPEIRIKTTVHQVYFALSRCAAGGKSWYLIRVGQYPDYYHYLIPGSLAEELFDKRISLNWLDNHSAIGPKSSAQQVIITASQMNCYSIPSN